MTVRYSCGTETNQMATWGTWKIVFVVKLVVTCMAAAVPEPDVKSTRDAFEGKKNCTHEVSSSTDMPFTENATLISPNSTKICSEGDLLGTEEGLLDLYIAGLFPFTGWWPGGEALELAALLALHDVNSRPDILPGYRLNMVWQNTQCTPRVATRLLQGMLLEGPAKLMLLGPATSDVSEATAQITYVWNVVQLSNVAVSPTLSNKDKYPWFFRVSAPEFKLNPARLAFLSHFNWTRVALVTQRIQFLLDAKTNLEDWFVKGNITTLADAEFDSAELPVSLALKEIKRSDARIIFGFFLVEAAYEIFCEAFHLGLYGPRYVWMIVPWYEDGWWIVSPDKLAGKCTPSEFQTAVEGVFTIGAIYLNPNPERGLAQITSMTFQSRYSEACDCEPRLLYGSQYAPQTYDAVWAIAKALNDTSNKLLPMGKYLHNFTYSDLQMATLIKESLEEVHFIGVKGDVSFDENGDPDGPVQFQRIMENHYQHLGFYFTPEAQFEWKENMSDIWNGGFVPHDSAKQVWQQSHVTLSLYAIMSVLACLGIMLALVFLVVNWIHRETRLIRMSSPRINNLILLGCILAYVTILCEPVTNNIQTATMMCKIYLTSIGFALTFASLFAKTWRIHVIFANKTTKSMIITDSQLLIMVGVLVSVDVVLCIVWELVDPLTWHFQNLGNQLIEELDVVIWKQVGLCSSEYQLYFNIASMVYHGLLLLFGVFLAWETRKVHVEEVNDSKQIAACIYNFLLPSVVSLAVGMVLPTTVNTRYAISSACLVLVYTLTQALIFGPKVYKLRRVPQEGSTSSIYSTSSSRAHAATDAKMTTEQT